MAFNPLAILQERQCAHVYDSIDSGRPANAVKECDALLAKEPTLHLASALKSIALCRLNRRDEATKVVDKLIKLDGGSLHTSILNVIAMSLSSLDRQEDEALVYDNASKAHPNDVELGAKACLAMARAKQWQKMQQTALRIHKAALANTKKGKQTDDLYFWWSMQAYCMAADDVDIPGHQLALPLAQRMIAKHLETNPFAERSDECMFLFARILQKSGKSSLSEAVEMLSSDPIGKALCKRSMTLAMLRREMQKANDEWSTIFTESSDALRSDVRNWTDVEDAVESAFKLVETSDNEGGAVKKLHDTLSELAAAEKNDRTSRLAVILLVRAAREKEQESSIENLNLIKLVSDYFDDFCGKACTYEDLSPAIRICKEQEKQTLLQKIRTTTHHDNGEQPFDRETDLNTAMNAVKMERLLQDFTACDSTTESQYALRCLRFHVRSQQLVKDLPRTEMQQCDDFALLCTQALLHAAHLEPENDAHLRLAFVVLRETLQRSPKAYRLRIVYVRLLLRIGAVDAARLQFNALGIKGVQYDTLGWTIAENCAHHTLLLRPESDEEREYLALLRQMRGVWREGQTQVPAMACKALEHGTFSRVEEMLNFGDRLTMSVARRAHIIDSLRLECMSVGTGVDVERLKIELIELQKASGKGKQYDQRDWRVMPDYLSSADTSIDALTFSGSTLPVYASLVATAFGIDAVEMAKENSPNASQGLDHLSEIAEVLRGGASIADGQIGDAYAAMYESLDKAINDVGQAPWSALSYVSSAFELAHFVRRIKVGKTTRTLAMDGLRKVKRRTETWIEELRSTTTASSSPPFEADWYELIGKLSSGKRNSKALFDEEGHTTKAHTIVAIEALLERITLFEKSNMQHNDNGDGHV